MHITKDVNLKRRTFLKGLGAVVALPYLEAMWPTTKAMAATTSPVPPRMAMFYFGTGMNMRQFTPETTGRDYKMSRILKPLEGFRDDFTVLSNTWLEKGGGHHGAYPFSTSVGFGEKQQISPDQIAASQIGGSTRYPSLQLSVGKGTAYGNQALATISWNEQGVPIPAENDPYVIFNKLFRPDAPEEIDNIRDDARMKKSVLDLVRDDASRMNRFLGTTDREKLDQYFTSIREIEKQVDRRVAWLDTPKPQPGLDVSIDESMDPDGRNNDFSYERYSKLMYDLIALAFQTDSTRVISYVVRRELRGGVYPEMDVSDGYHSLTHHGNDPRKLEDLAKVDTIYMQHWAHFLDRLKSIPEGDGNLLDYTMLGFSSGMGIGHSKSRLPTVLCGGSKLGISHQGHVELEENTPLSSVWHTMLDRMNVAVEGQFQDSRGPIGQLIA